MPLASHTLTPPCGPTDSAVMDLMAAVRLLRAFDEESSDALARRVDLMRSCDRWHKATLACAAGCPRAATRCIAQSSVHTVFTFRTALRRGLETVVFLLAPYYTMYRCYGPCFVLDEESGTLERRDMSALEYRAAMEACRRWSPGCVRRSWIAMLATSAICDQEMH